MTTSENAASVNVDQLPELPEGFHWLVTSAPSSIDSRIIQTRLWLRGGVAESAEYSMDGFKVIAWANITKGSAWIQDPTVTDLRVHAEGLLAKTSNRWALGLPTELEKPAAAL
jgi:hypothetical protein